MRLEEKTLINETDLALQFCLYVDEYLNENVAHLIQRKKSLPRFLAGRSSNGFPVHGRRRRTGSISQGPGISGRFSGGHRPCLNGLQIIFSVRLHVSHRVGVLWGPHS